MIVLEARCAPLACRGFEPPVLIQSQLQSDHSLQCGVPLSHVPHVAKQHRPPFDTQLHERVPLTRHSVVVGGGRCQENLGWKWDGKLGQPRW
jgi:hypothetical protein